MTSRRNLLLNIFYDFLTFVSLHTVFAMIITASFGLSAIPFSYLLVFPFYFYSFLRFKIKNIALFVFLSLLPFLFLCFMPDVISAAIYLMFILMVFIYSTAVRLSKRIIDGGAQLAVPSLVINFFCAVLNQYLKLNVPDIFFLANSTLAIICYILVTHMTNVDGSLSLLSAIGPQPVKPILRFNNRTMVVFVMLIAIFAVISRIIRLDFLWVYIFRGLFLLIKWILSLIAGVPKPAPVERTESGMNLFGLFGEPTEPNIIFVIIGQIIIFLAYFLTFALALFTIVFTLYKFYQKFYASSMDEIDAKEFAAPLYKINKENFILKKIKDLFPVNSKSMRIRRLFYKKVKAYLGKGVKVESNNTAQTISKKILKYEDIGNLTNMYEKARYSKEI